MAENMFENLSGLQNLYHFTGDSPEDLSKQIQAIRLPARIISIYGGGAKHYAWIQTSSPIKKVILKKAPKTQGE